MSLTYDTLHGEGDLTALSEILAWAFGFSVADARTWPERAKAEDFRLLREEGRVVACALLLPMGQFFGGVRVPMTGIAAVGTAPDCRGRGLGAELMRRVVRELGAANVPLSGLYPATRSLYRLVGYAPAGSRWEIRVPVATIDVRDRGLDLRAMRPEDEPAMLEIYRATAALSNGPLDRNEYMWRRVRHPRGEQPARGFVLHDAGHLAGYVYVVETRGKGKGYDLRVTDMVVRSAAAARRALTFFGDHRSLAEDVVWNGAPSDPLIHALPEVGFSMRLEHQWMIRVTDVAAALAARGYPPLVRAELHFEVADDLVPENHDRFVLHVEGGKGAVTRGGHGSIQLDVRALAPLYTSHLAARSLAAAGLLCALEEQLAEADLVFGGPAPWTADMY